MPGSGGAVGGGVREKDYGIGPFITVEAEGSDPVQVLWGGDGARVSGVTHIDAAC